MCDLILGMGKGVFSATVSAPDALFPAINLAAIVMPVNIMT